MVLKVHRRAGRSGADGMLRSRRRKVAQTAGLGVLSCTVAAAGLMLPADAAVRAGHTVFVLKNDSSVEAEGFAPGQNVEVRVRRNGVLVGFAEAAASDGGTVAVNHDTCWSQYTPQILPGDLVVVRDRSGADRVRVADIHVTEGPVRTGSSFTIKGTVNGTPPPVGELLVEARTNTPIRFRPLAPDVADGVTGTIAYDGAGGDFTATFTGLSAQQQEAADNLGEFLVAHAPSAGEMTIATEGDPVPGPGCGLDAPSATEAVSVASPQVINRKRAGATLRVQGFSQDAGEVVVRLRDNDPSTAGGASKTATLSSAGGAQTWTARFSAAELAGLNRRITVTAVVDGTRASTTQTVVKDLVAPRAPRASVRSGTYRRPQHVSINRPQGVRVRYTLRHRGAPRPTATRGRLYRGGQIRIPGTRTLKMVSIDRAGNVSRVVRERYVIRRAR